MSYKFLSLLLLLAVATDASAQTAPARKAKTAPSATGRTKAAASNTMAETPADTKGQSQNIYAAPGQPIIVPDGKVGPYDGPAARRKTTKSGTTLSPR